MWPTAWRNVDPGSPQLGRGWPYLGLGSPYLGAMLGLCWAILGPCWAHVGHPGAILGLCWAILGRSWGHLGAKCRFLSKSTKHRKLRYITWSAAGAGSRIAKAGGFCRLSPTALEKEEAVQNGKRIPKAKAPLGRATHG